MASRTSSAAKAADEPARARDATSIVRASIMRTSCESCAFSLSHSALSAIRNANPAVYTETRPKIAGRFLVLKIEQIVDAPENLDLLIHLIFRRQIDDGISGREG